MVHELLLSHFRHISLNSHYIRISCFVEFPSTSFLFRELRCHPLLHYNFQEWNTGNFSLCNQCLLYLPVQSVLYCRHYKPFGFFSLFALLLAVVSVLFFIPVLAEYFATGLVLKFPTLIVCGFVMLAAIQSFLSCLMIISSCSQVSLTSSYPGKS